MSRSDPRILLVEDNPDDVELTLRALVKSNVAHSVVVAADGQQALDHLAAAAARTDDDPHAMPHVVLLDLKLPKVDGHEVLRRMRSDPRLRRVPVVILTSSTEERDVSRSYDLGANSYLRKPVEFDRFMGVARQLGEYWLVLNEAPPPSLE